jgi:hypothetical protein
MKLGLRSVIAAGLAFGLISSASGPAAAGNGAGVAGFVTGLWVGNALARPPAYYPQPTYVQPTYVQPTYVQPTYVQPAPVYPARNCWRRERWQDPYAGWIWRDVWVC